MRIATIEQHEQLIAFLGESLGKIFQTNLDLFAAKKSAKIFRMCQDRNRLKGI